MKILPAIFSGRTAAVAAAGVLMLTGLPAFCAPVSGSEDLLLGDKAYAAGDYEAAERFYRKATVLLASPLWEKAALQLCHVCLKKGDITAAGNILREFQKRNPEKSAGILAGMVPAADGSYREAEKAFREVISSNSPERLEAIYQLGSMYLQTGRYDDAVKCFSELADSPIPAEKKRGQYGKIYTLIRKGDTAEAGKVLNMLPQKEKTVRKLRLLLYAGAQDIPAFKDSYLKERESKKDPSPDKLLYEICRSGAALAAARGDNDFTALLLQDSFACAPGDAERKDVMHRLFNLQSRFDHEGAIATLRHYQKAFPEAGDKALLQIQGGRLLTSAGKYKEALELFNDVIKDEDNLLDERRSAAYDAAIAAEKGGIYAEAEQMHRYLINRSTTPARKQASEFRLGEFFLRRKNYEAAEKYFYNVLIQKGDLAENARFMLLQTFVESNQPEKAKKAAARLIHAKNPRHAGAGRYQLARLTELEGNYAEARKLYLDCVKNSAADICAPPAAFAAARLAEQLGDPAAAAGEFLTFAQKYPADANAASALFYALRAGCFSGKKETASQAFELLKTKYAASPEYNAALLQLAHFYFNSGDVSAALELLKNRPAGASPETESSFTLLHARILLAQSRSAEALQEAAALLQKYPQGPDAAETNLLCGNILSDLGEIKTALLYFRQAEKLNSSGIFGEIVSGRIADCLKVLYSGSDFDRSLLKEARERYDKLAADAHLPAIRLQSLCKAAACCELVNEYTQAAELYERTLYLARLIKSNGIQPDPAWCARAAYAGARNALKSKRPEKLVRAMRMLRLYEDLKLTGTGEDFNSLRQELRNSYNLLKRKEQK